MNTARTKPSQDTAAATDVLPRLRTANLARLLVVNDDAAIRLKLADLLAAQYPDGRIDTCSETAAAAIGPVVRDYRGVLVVVDFAPAVPAGDPLAIVQQVRSATGTGAVVVIGRNGDERSAIRALRAGASDYWPLHNVDAAALIEGLRAANASVTAEAEPPGALASVPGFRTLKELRRSAGTSLYLAESVESGERLDDALRREVWEETGLRVKALSTFEIFERIMPDTQGRAEYHYVLIDSVCKVVGGELRAGDDVSRVEWVPRSRLVDYRLTEGTLEVIERAFDHARRKRS